jgi:hypothetical protein
MREGPIYTISKLKPIPDVFSEKRYEISITLRMSLTARDNWIRGGHDIVRHCFNVSKPYKSKDEDERAQLQKAVTFLEEKLYAKNPFDPSNFN